MDLSGFAPRVKKDMIEPIVGRVENKPLIKTQTNKQKLKTQTFWNETITMDLKRTLTM